MLSWGTEAIQALSRLATRLSTSQGRPKSLVCSEIFGGLTLAIVRANLDFSVLSSLCS